MKVEIEVDIPDGYEATGEFRRADSEECWLSASGKVAAGPTGGRHIILRKKRYYRPLTHMDVGKTAEVRYFDEWKSRLVVGFSSGMGAVFYRDPDEQHMLRSVPHTMARILGE